VDKYINFLYNTFIGRILLKIVTTRFYSKINAIYLKSRFSKHKINKYIKKYNINIEEFEEKNYTSFNDFFIRKLKKNTREIDMNTNSLIAIADAKLSTYFINDKLELNIKNSIYNIKELVKNDKVAEEYLNGICCVYRLTVDDYHRYCFLDNGNVKSSNKIKGILHTVRPIAVQKYKVYIQNTREWSILCTENFGDVIQIEVGALTVGKIKNNNKNSFFKGEEKGYFEFGGSTIILLFKENTVKINEEIKNKSKKGIEKKVEIGEKIGEKIC